MKRALVALSFAACSQPAPAPTKPVGGGPGSGLSMVPSDASPATQEETLAAIQKAMNDLHGGAQSCWAVAATDRYDFSGDLVMRIDVGPMKSTAAVVRDNVHADKLVACMSQLLGAYKYPPPLYGQTIQLPFQFDKVDGQSIIDRQLVETHTQGSVSVGVLLDKNNTGNANASMFEVGVSAGAETGWRKAERAEVWYFQSAAKVNTGTVDAGDMLYVPAGVQRNIGARDGALRATLVIAPGGAEGVARAGALPTPAASDKPDKPVVVLRAKDAKTFGPATIYLDSAETKGAPFAASILQMPAGVKVPEHVHANETEMLYVLEGSGTMTIAGTDVAVAPTSVIQIPPNTKHAFVASTAVKAVQVYTPGGPEQRFKKRP
jgi:quercetin dioxygenase-like cupin family protein